MTTGSRIGFSRPIWAFFALAALLTCAFGEPVAADEWWNDQWQYRTRIGFDTTTTGADIKSNLSDFPVLVRLHAGNFNFMNAADTGEDIRFVSANHQVVLKHHVEKFDTIDEIAYLWVKIPQISGAATADFIWMYYGNKAAVGGQDDAATFDAQHVAVFHLGELEGPPQDATAYANHAASFSGGQGLPSVIGNGVNPLGCRGSPGHCRVAFVDLRE